VEQPCGSLVFPATGYAPSPLVAGPIEASSVFTDGASTFLPMFSPKPIKSVRRNGDWNARVADTYRPTTEDIMNWDRIEGDWKQFKGKVQQQWGKLTNDDIDVIEGNRTELLGVIQKRYGLAKDEAERQVDTWMKTLN
jgi:uncharacterized protein YjbJ (UPF0337 family)